ncbi:MAG: SGNH/GDSL hydrolase family protein [Oligoflexia bacterium]|nr:SGNH/GDSL hydrolase family protein [Oligoflexia bacterium]
MHHGPHNRPSKIRRLAYATVVFLLLMATGEAVARLGFQADLRAWQSPPPQPEEDAPLMRGNPYLLWELAPGVRDQRGFPIRINSLGLRGPELAVPKPPGRRRLVTVGDSSVFGDGVADGQVFGEITARTLGPEVDLVNAAVPGYSTFQCLNLLRMRVMDLQPDLLVIANLWSDNNFDSFVDRDLLSAYAAWDQSPVAKLRRLLSASALFRLADWRLRVAGRAQRLHKVGFTLGSEIKLGPRRVAIQDYARNLDTMVDLARSHGAEVLFMVLANREDLKRGRHPPAAWEPYRQVMRDTARRRGAQIIEVPRLFLSSGRSADELFVDEMHPSALGHRIIARELTDLLRLAAWPQGGTVSIRELGGEIPRYRDPAIAPRADPN